MLSSVALLVFGMMALKMFARISEVPRHILMPGLLLFCVYGTYAIQNSQFDILLMFTAGLFGYFMMRLDFPVAPFLIAFVLGPMFEDNLRRTILLSHGEIGIFFRSPICWIFAVLTVLSLFLGIRSSRRSGKAEPTAPDAA